MPYIKQERREVMDGNNRDPQTPGELNYAITQLIFNYYWRENQDYQTINDIVGALEGAKLEFYRRVAAPYENAKCKENGDVY